MLLKQGSKGSDVTTLQNNLKAAGYDVGSIDGIFGPKTLSAVQQYQKSQGLTVDGIAGPNTLSKFRGTTPVATTTKSSSSGAPAIPKIDPFKLDESNKPALPTIAPPPEVEAFNPNIDKAQLQQDALDLLKPQYDRGQEQLDLYSQNFQTINDETLKRGLGRGSYVGNRQDRETTEHGKRLVDLDRSYNEQANTMAAQEYDKQWGRQYQLHRDTTEDTWRNYGAGVDNAWRNHGALMDLYNIDVDNQRFGYQTDVDSKQFNYNAQYGQHRDSVADKQWQEGFDWQKYMDGENLKLAKSRGSGGGGRSGSSSGGSVDWFTEAYNDVFNTGGNPGINFNSKKSQYKSALSSEEFAVLQAEVNKANKAKYGSGQQSLAKPKSQKGLIM